MCKDWLTKHVRFLKLGHRRFHDIDEALKQSTWELKCIFVEDAKNIIKYVPIKTLKKFVNNAPVFRDLTLTISISQEGNDLVLKYEATNTFQIGAVEKSIKNLHEQLKEYLQSEDLCR